MSLTRYLRQALNNSLFGKTSALGALASAPTIYVGLSSTTPATDGTNVTEPSGDGYARVATPASDWNAATSADPSVVNNSAMVSFAAASGGSWVSGANLTYFVLYDALTSGNLLAYGALLVQKPVTDGDVAEFPATTLVCNFT